MGYDSLGSGVCKVIETSIQRGKHEMYYPSKLPKLG